MCKKQACDLWFGQAIEAGQGSGDNWAEFKYRHRQAEQDSQLLYTVLQQAEQFHQVCIEPCTSTHTKFCMSDSNWPSIATHACSIVLLTQ